jgi:hypothetical protein
MAATMCSRRAFTGRVAQKAAAPVRTRAVVVSCSKQGRGLYEAFAIARTINGQLAKPECLPIRGSPLACFM